MSTTLHNKFNIVGSQMFGSVIFFLVISVPILIAIWFVPWFVTQDGPLHVYNAHLLSALSDEQLGFNGFYARRGGLLPYIGLYKLLSVMMSIVSPRAADRVLMTLTAIGLACSVLWLRWRVMGWQDMFVIVPLALLIGISRLWLLGLYSFLLGAALFALILGLWWSWRNGLNLWRVAIISALLAGSYFFHVISTAVAVVGLIILALTTPGSNWRTRLVWTAASTVPSILLMFGFGALMSSSTGAGANWTELGDASSIQSWIDYLQAPDFLSFSFKEKVGFLFVPTDLPFADQSSLSYALIWPTLWAIAGLMLVVAPHLRRRGNVQRLLASERRGWFALAACLFAAGFFGPSNAGQGSILRERLLLLGVMSVVPLISYQPGSSTARAGALCLAAAASFQLAFVLDYARISNKIAQRVMEVAPHLENRQRIALVVPDPRTHYLLNPLPNIANQLGVAKNVVAWNNYGPAYYYFPVAFASDRIEGRWRRIDSLNRLLLSGEAQGASENHPEQWVTALGDALEEVDVLIVWGSRPWFDVQGQRAFQPAPFFEDGEVRAFKRK